MDVNRVAKIQKLMDVANDAATPPEAAETYRAKAYALMLEWQVTDEQLARAGKIKSEEIIMRRIYPTTPRSYSAEYTALMAHVANAMGLKGLVEKTHRAADGTWLKTPSWVGVVVGYESDADALELLIMSLSVQCEMAVARAVTEHPRWLILSASEKWNYKRSFIIGFANEVTRRIKESRKQVIAETGPGTELMLVDRSKKVADWLADNVKTKEVARRQYGNGYAAGATAGREANIGQTTLGASRKELGR